jgi:hypothetical protein
MPGGQRQLQPFLGLAELLLVQDLLGGLGCRAVEAGRISRFVAQCRVREGEVADRQIAAAQRDRQIDEMLRVAGERRHHDWLEVRPDFLPKLRKGYAEARGMLRADDRKIAVVVQRCKLGAVGDINRLGRAQHQPYRGFEFRRPALRRTQRGAAPVVGADQGPHLAAATQERQYVHIRPRRQVRSFILPRPRARPNPPLEPLMRDLVPVRQSTLSVVIACASARQLSTAGRPKALVRKRTKRGRKAGRALPNDAYSSNGRPACASCRSRCASPWVSIHCRRPS